MNHILWLVTAHYFAMLHTCKFFPNEKWMDIVPRAMLVHWCEVSHDVRHVVHLPHFTTLCVTSCDAIMFSHCLYMINCGQILVESYKSNHTQKHIECIWCVLKEKFVRQNPVHCVTTVQLELPWILFINSVNSFTDHASFSYKLGPCVMISPMFHKKISTSRVTQLTNNLPYILYHKFWNWYHQ